MDLRLSLLNPLEAKPSLTQSVADRGDVRGATCLERDIDDGFAQADTVVGAVMHRLDNVGALASQNLREVEKRAGTIEQIDTNAQQAPILHETALDDLGEECDVDIAAANENDSAAVAKVDFGLNDRC